MDAMKIEFKDYSLRFGDKNVIEKSSSTFQSGINLLIGRNGSGKTSLLKSIPLLNRNWNGKIIVNDHDLKALDIKSHFGFQFEVDFLSNNLYPKEMLSFSGKVQGITGDILKSKIEELVSFFEIDAKTEIQFLSYGNKKKLLLALSLLNNPKGLIWDEPFEGLDEIITAKIIDLIKSNKQEIVIIATNSMYLAQEISSPTVLINKNKQIESIGVFDLEYIRGVM